MNSKKIFLGILIALAVIVLTGCELFSKGEEEESIESILYSKIDIENKTNITQDINLVSSVSHEENEYAVNWLSMDVNVITNSGVVTRFNEHKFVQLIAKVEGYEREKKFDLVVIKELTAIEEVERAFNLNEIDKEVSADIVLPETFTHNETEYAVTYETNNEAITSSGIFTQPAEDTLVEIKATLSNNNETVEKTFTFVAKASGTNPEYISDLIFSEYIEGSGYNKAFELYNGTGQTIILDDYKVVFIINGTTEESITLSGKINHNECISFIYDDSRNTLTDTKNRNIMFDIAINGDDVIELQKSEVEADVLVDTIGTLDFLAVSGNEEFLKDKTLVRNANIKNPNTDFAIAEWTEMPRDTFSNFGTTEFDVPQVEDRDRIAPSIQFIKSKILYQNFEDVDFKTYFEVQDNLDEEVDLTNAIIEFDKEIDKYFLEAYNLTLVASDLAGNYSAMSVTIEVVTKGEIPLSDAAIEYYKNVQALTGDALKDALNDLISNHITYPYTSNDTDTWDILKDVDEDSNNPENIIGIYSGQSIPKGCQDTTTPPDYCNGVEWNREHVWSKSRGDFGEEPPAGTDIHHLFAEERTLNSTKNNRFFTDCALPTAFDVIDRENGNFTCNEWHFEPRDEVKGDVARIIFYMAVRYEGENGEVDLEIFNDGDYDTDKGSKLPYYGDLEILLQWHMEDPVSIREVERNEKVFGYQENRNPFIDYPDFVNKIFG